MATSSASIGGLVSGLDTKTLISQLMQVAARPQTLLKNQLATTTAQTTAAQNINAKAATVTSLAKDLADAKTYTQASATSSDPSVTATTTSAAASGSVTFTVTQLAAAHTVLSDAFDSGAGAPSITLSSGSGASATSTSYSGTSVSDLAATINKDASATVTATVVGDGTAQRLQLTAKATGAANAFTVSGSGFTDSSGDSVATTLRQGQDARIALGDPSSGDGAVTISSSSNTFKNLMTGVDVTVSAKDKTATVSTSVSASSISTKASGLVAAMNTLLSDLAFHTKQAPGSTPSSTSGGLLAGESTFRDLANDVLDTISGSTGSDAAVRAGLSVARDGTVSIDTSKFEALFKSDPTTAQDVLSSFAKSVQQAGDRASNPTSGSITGWISGAKTSTSSLTDRISAWDVRLDAQEEQLNAKYAALETALQKIKSQSDSLTQALNGLSSKN